MGKMKAFTGTTGNVQSLQVTGDSSSAWACWILFSRVGMFTVKLLSVGVCAHVVFTCHGHFWLQTEEFRALRLGYAGSDVRCRYDRQLFGKESAVVNVRSCKSVPASLTERKPFTLFFSFLSKCLCVLPRLASEKTFQKSDESPKTSSFGVQPKERKKEKRKEDTASVCNFSIKWWQNFNGSTCSFLYINTSRPDLFIALCPGCEIASSEALGSISSKCSSEEAVFCLILWEGCETVLKMFSWSFHMNASIFRSLGWKSRDHWLTLRANTRMICTFSLLLPLIFLTNRPCWHRLQER